MLLFVLEGRHSKRQEGRRDVLHVIASLHQQARWDQCGRGTDAARWVRIYSFHCSIPKRSTVERLFSFLIPVYFLIGDGTTMVWEMFSRFGVYPHPWNPFMFAGFSPTTSTHERKHTPGIRSWTGSQYVTAARQYLSSSQTQPSLPTPSIRSPSSTPVSSSSTTPHYTLSYCT